jgi:hypothetical protein
MVEYGQSLVNTASLLAFFIIWPQEARHPQFYGIPVEGQE